MKGEFRCHSLYVKLRNRDREKIEFPGGLSRWHHLDINAGFNQTHKLFGVERWNIDWACSFKEIANAVHWNSVFSVICEPKKAHINRAVPMTHISGTCNNNNSYEQKNLNKVKKKPRQIDNLQMVPWNLCKH